MIPSEVYIYQNKKERKWEKRDEQENLCWLFREPKSYHISMWFEGREVSISIDVIFKKDSVIPPTATQSKIINEKEEEEVNSKVEAEDEEHNNDDKEKLDKCQ